MHESRAFSPCREGLRRLSSTPGKDQSVRGKSLKTISARRRACTVTGDVAVSQERGMSGI